MEELGFEVERLRLTTSQSNHSIIELQQRLDDRSQLVHRLHLEVVSMQRNVVIEEQRARQFDSMIDTNKTLTHNIAQLQHNVYGLEHQIIQCNQ